MQIQSFNSKYLVRSVLLTGALAVFAPSAVLAQQTDSMAMPMDHSKVPGMDHGAMSGMSKDGGKKMDMGKDNAMPMDHGAMPGMGKDGAMSMDHSKMPGMNQGAMRGMGKDVGMKMDMGAMQGGPAPANARDPDTYADGLNLGPMQGMEMADNIPRSQVLLDRLEWTHTRGGSGQALDAQAWFGGDIDKLWLKLDGERSGGKLGATRTEALWNHAISTYWGLQTGVRHDFGDGPSRNWLALGVQGLAPYWFDVQATAYVGQQGRTALRFEPEYDLLLTQRLILQPNAKVNLYGKNDPERGIGSGLSDMEAGLRLRYELSRKFAPYIGVVYNRKFGTTAQYAGKPASETRFVAGVRIWF
jgi:copper resistance protein B